MYIHGLHCWHVLAAFPLLLAFSPQATLCIAARHCKLGCSAPCEINPPTHPVSPYTHPFQDIGPSSIPPHPTASHHIPPHRAEPQYAESNDAVSFASMSRNVAAPLLEVAAAAEGRCQDVVETQRVVGVHPMPRVRQQVHSVARGRDAVLVRSAPAEGTALCLQRQVSSGRVRPKLQ